MKTKIMRATAALTAVILSASMVKMPSLTPMDAKAADNVVVSPYNAYKVNDGVFEGWGTSLCWWANRVGYSDSLSEQAAEKFFGDSGLRMNIARYNIGGGDDPSHTHITRTDSDIPGYTVYNNGAVSYDWNADANQRNVLFKSIDACKDGLIVEMFSNSPPYYMTKSGCSSGNTDGGKNNLKDDMYDDFAEYFANVCDHFTNVWGVDIQSAAPMNEPYTNFWYAGSPKQEGCHFDIGNSESTVLIELDKAMKRHGLDDVIISSSDETSIDTTIDAYNALSAEAKACVGRIDTHTYGGSKRSQLKDLALKNGMNLWMSEVDGGATAGSNNGEMGAALWLAERMAIDLNGMNPSAWILWQAIDKHICAAGYNGKKDSGMPDITTGFWGLAVADHDNNNIILTKKYYAFGQFSRFIRPGATMLNASGTNVAAYDKDNKQLVIVAVNTSGNAREMSYDMSQFNSVGASAKVIRTSGDVKSGENWKELSPVAVNNKSLSVSLLANSVTTFIIDNVEFKDVALSEIPVKSTSGSNAWKDSTDNNYEKAFDGNLSTYFDGLGNGYAQADLGDVYDITAIGIAPRSGYAYRCVEASVYFSANGTDWVEGYKLTNEPFDGMNYYTSLNNNNGVRYVRYQTPAGAPTYSGNKDSSCCCNIAEFKVFGELAGNSSRIPLKSDMITGSAPWRDSVNDCKKVIDGNTETYFDGVANGWVQIDLGKSMNISSVAYCPRKGYEARSVDAVFSYSNDGVNWTELYTETSLPSYGMKNIPMDSPVRMRYLRYSVPEGAPKNSYNKDDVYCCNIAEIALYEAEASGLKGDVNGDGVISLADLVTLSKWLLGTGNIELSENADICEDNVIDAFDLVMLRQILLDK